MFASMVAAYIIPFLNIIFNLYKILRFLKHFHLLQKRIWDWMTGKERIIPTKPFVMRQYERDEGIISIQLLQRGNLIKIIF